MATVGIFGATGNIGQGLLTHIVEEPGIEEIRIITNRPRWIDLDVDYANEEGKRVAIVEADYCTDESAVIETLRGCSRLFVVLPQSLSSPDMIVKGKFLVDCAVAAEVESIVRISSLGIDEQSIKFVGSQGPLGDAHVAVENYCAEKGLKYVSLRPTSLFSNIQFNVEEIGSNSTISTPLGTTAKVNWVSCDDIAKVAAKVLAAKKWDEFGRIIDITGPRENTLGAEEMAHIISSSVDKSVKYREVDVPPVPDYASLWCFLRKGGYDCDCDSVKTITGATGQLFSEIKIAN
mmetsp:Transcript_19675/g.44932  ORF Transcript_19675/g.44932 Transcript_19675/m.44932 type:complete len:291 (+) Transcript_19675:100-972(+)